MIEKTSQREAAILVSLIIVSLIILGLDKIKFLNFIKSPAERLINPINRWLYKRKQNSSSPANDPEKQKKLNQLEMDKTNLMTKIDILEQENSSMRKLLSAPLPAKFQFIPAQVLAWENGILTIDQGSDNGLIVNQIVVTENFLVGRITSLNPRSSRVSTPLNPKEQLKAKVLKSNVKGIVKTDKQGRFILDEVLQQAVLKPEETVITTGEDEIYPPNLIIAKIVSAEKKESEVYQQAVLAPFFDFGMLNTIFVIKK